MSVISPAVTPALGARWRKVPAAERMTAATSGSVPTRVPSGPGTCGNRSSRLAVTGVASWGAMIARAS
jgi:hypothetical protein